MRLAMTIGPRQRSGTMAAAALIAACWLIGTGPAGAQTMPNISTPPHRPAPPPPDDGLAGGGFYLEADQLISDQANHHVTAKGSVQARYQGRVLRTDQLDYDSATGVVVARGHVEILNADGTAQFADAMTLDKDMSQGVALGFSTRLDGVKAPAARAEPTGPGAVGIRPPSPDLEPSGIKIAAASAVRQSDEVTVLDNVVFTPCRVCAQNGHDKPTWSIRARQVIEDKKRRTLKFKHAVIQVKGVGILYLPAFITADPTAQRKSGFLLPLASISGTRGFSYEQPYYQVISSSQDITLSPQINSKVNPFINIDWRRRFYSGVVDVRAGYTYEYDFDSSGANVPGSAITSRSYILAAGLFNPSPNWQWGFTAERTSDPLLFQKYSVPDVYEDRGLYAADDQRLISQLYAVRQDQSSYLSVAAISIQGLRPTDSDRSIPLIAPLVEGRWEAPFDILGGRLRIDGSAVILTQQVSFADPALPGVDSRRATLGIDWRRTFTLADGLRLSPFLLGRGDVYGLGDLLGPGPTTATVARGLGTLGMDISYPLIKQVGSATWILEPLAQIDLSPNARQDPRIPNEDSIDWELDETNLFAANSSPGFDLYESGARLNVGGRATLTLDDGRGGSFLVGRSLSTRDDPAIPIRTGLETALSDYVVAAEATPIEGLRLFSRWRLDSSSFKVNYLEAGADFNYERLAGYVRYYQEAQSPSGVPIRDLDVRGEVYATKHWGVTANLIRDVLAQSWRREELGIVYRDDCIKAEVVFRRDDTIDRTLGPTSSVVFRLMLATFGNSGYRR